MDAKSIPDLTEQYFGQAYVDQLVAIATHYTPARLLNLEYADERVEFTRYYSNTKHPMGFWKLERRGAEWHLYITVDDIMRQQYLTPSLMLVNHKIHSSLLEWTKVCNGIELEVALQGVPGLAHITAASVADRAPFDARDVPGIPWK